MQKTQSPKTGLVQQVINAAERIRTANFSWLTFWQRSNSSPELSTLGRSDKGAIF
jgi:hypothetical protein